MRRQWPGFILTWASAFPTVYPILKFCLKRNLPRAITKSSPTASSRIRDSRPVGAPALDAHCLRAGGSPSLGRALFARRWEPPALDAHCLRAGGSPRPWTRVVCAPEGAPGLGRALFARRWEPPASGARCLRGGGSPRRQPLVNGSKYAWAFARGPCCLRAFISSVDGGRLYRLRTSAVH